MSVVIGDIHGQIDQLKALLKHVPAQSTLVFIGDYIDKGKDPRAVIELVIGLKKKRRVVCLLGNHEFKFLQALEGNEQAKEFMWAYGGAATVGSYLGRPVAPGDMAQYFNDGSLKKAVGKHLGFLRALKVSHEYKDFYMVHGGIPLDRAGRFHIGNVEKMVFARRDFLPVQKKFRGKVVVFGHTAFKEVFWDGFKLGIDTGAVYPRSEGYGILSAVDLDRFECVTHEGKRYIPQLVKGAGRG